MIYSFKKAHAYDKSDAYFTLCGFATGWFHHVWLIDRVPMMKRPQLQKYQKGGKPICASYADSQSCSSPQASCVCCRLIYSSHQLDCIGRLGRTHPIRPSLIQTTGSWLLRTCSESSGVRMMVAAGLRPGPLCSSGDSEISVCTVGGAESEPVLSSPELRGLYQATSPQAQPALDREP